MKVKLKSIAAVVTAFCMMIAADRSDAAPVGFSFTVDQFGPENPNGVINGHFVVDDLNGDGTVTVAELLSFNFQAANFTDAALNFSGDESSFDAFSPLNTGNRSALNADLNWYGVIFTQNQSKMLRLKPNLADVVLVSTTSELHHARSNSVQVIPNPLPPTLVLILAALGGLGVLGRFSRREPVMS